MSAVAFKDLPLKVGYTRLGHSGLKISKIVLGCMSYGNKTWADWVLEGDEALEHFNQAYKMGINTWDGADMYSAGDSEILMGQAIKKFNIPREDLVIFTKTFFPVANKGPRAIASAMTDPNNQGYLNQHGLSRKHIFASVDASLERLGVEYIDLLQCHRFDPECPIEETMQALHDVVQSGKVRYIGMSSCYAYQFQAMQNYAKTNKTTCFISMQHYHNAIYREEEREMFPTLEMLKVGSLPWSPLARGYLARPYADQSTNRASSDRNYARFVGLGKASQEEALQQINKAVETIALARGVPMAAVSLAWSMQSKGVSAPIVGTTNLKSLEELVRATHLVLTKEEVEAINAPYIPREIAGH